MVPPYEIFRREKDDSLTACELASTFDIAKARINVLATKIPAQYVIFDRRTIDCMTINTADHTTRKPQPPSPSV
jgi:hypothetical protein